MIESEKNSREIKIFRIYLYALIITLCISETGRWLFVSETTFGKYPYLIST